MEEEEWRDFDEPKKRPTMCPDPKRKNALKRVSYVVCLFLVLMGGVCGHDVIRLRVTIDPNMQQSLLNEGFRSLLIANSSMRRPQDGAGRSSKQGAARPPS
jgi:hypothetical protein